MDPGISEISLARSVIFYSCNSMQLDATRCNSMQLDATHATHAGWGGGDPHLVQIFGGAGVMGGAPPKFQEKLHLPGADHAVQSEETGAGRARATRFDAAGTGGLLRFLAGQVHTQRRGAERGDGHVQFEQHVALAAAVRRARAAGDGPADGRNGSARGPGAGRARAGRGPHYRLSKKWTQTGRAPVPFLSK
eukprot:gene22850-biopygen8802